MKPTPEYIRHVLSYDPDTGHIAWKNPPSPRVHPGMPAGSIDSTGYRQIQISGRCYQAHRVAWVYVYGVWPDHLLDHINGNRLDNSIRNLRSATQKQNLENQKLRSDNKTGYRGVQQRRNNRRFVASINHNQQQIYLGSFDTAEEAAAAAKAARDQLFTHHKTEYSA